MRNLFALISAAIVAAVFNWSTAALAQTAQETVHFTLEVKQPSLFDPSMNDVFEGSVDDRTGTTSFEVKCSAGSSALLGWVRSDEACAVTGSGMIKNPNNPAQTARRINYEGGFTIRADQDGYTDARTIAANYVAVGTAAANSSSFGGHISMMPENPSAGALALGQAVIDNLKKKAGAGNQVEYDTQIDSMTFVQFSVPSVGLSSAEPCAWTGDFIYSYAADAWQGAFDVVCGDKTYRLEGSMPLLNDNEYQINLIVPGAGAGDPFAAPDPFATVNGVTGSLKFKNAGRKTADDVFELVTVEGDLVGNGVPLEIVRGWGQIMIIFGRTFFGA